MEYVLQTHNLTKIYNRTEVVSNVNMSVKKGSIYGLIGLNGAGKTTLIRMITSLIAQNKGSVELFGKTQEEDLRKQRERIGCVIESPAFYPNLTAVQNLEYYRILKGIPEKSIIQKALKTSGLGETGKKKYKNFSLGMKQRLGMALAIMNNSDFIMLDEPTNGLDPIGIIEMRETIKKLNEEHGITFLISSHILNELSQVATHYGIINKGKLVRQLSSEELKEECKRYILIRTDNVVKVAKILETDLHIHNYKVTNENEIRIYEKIDNTAEITYQLNIGGVKVETATEAGNSLEDYFTTLIGGMQNV